MKSESPKNYSDLWMLISIILGAGWFIYYNGEPKRYIKTTKEYPIDSVWQDDSMYVIKSKIDTVYYDPQEQEPPPERP